MAAPDGNVYVEMMAPDFRFTFALLLLVLLALFALRPRRSPERIAAGSKRPVLLLLATLAVAFVPWLATSGNGRYFLAGLLLAGPVCVGLAWLLPVTRSLRLTAAVGMLALQAFAIVQTAPWRAWTFAAWEEPPYFQLDVPAEWGAQPATFLTMSAISYSLVAPLFHPQSRWMSLHQATAPDAATASGRRTEVFLSEAQAGPLLLFVPALRDMMTAQRLPDDRLAGVIDQQLAPYRLALARPRSCQFLPSRTLAGMGLGEKTEEARVRSGFWLCHLTRPAPGTALKTSRGQRHEAVFRAVEALCPRMFPAGGDGETLALPNGEVRSYFFAEMKVYVYDNGEVYYKYYRALNPVLVGQAADLLAGRTRLDCSRIRSRSALPWERGI